MSQKKQPTLVEVQQLFEQWRRGKKRRDRIPEALWEAAVSLSRHLSANRIAKLLHLNLTEVMDHIRTYKEGDGMAAFIELDPSECTAQAAMISLGAAVECVIEMEKAGGAKMKICFKGNCPDIAGLSKAFWGEA